jgi:hypothetical protein
MASPTQDRRYGVVGSVAFKAPCAAASTGNLTLSGTTQILDGVTPASGDRVLVKNQTDSADNGIYDVDTSAWTRSYDFNGNYDIKKGTLVYVTAGTSAGKGLWTVTAADPITVDTDNITFASVLATT